MKSNIAIHLHVLHFNPPNFQGYVTSLNVEQPFDKSQFFLY